MPFESIPATIDALTPALFSLASVIVGVIGPLVGVLLSLTDEFPRRGCLTRR
ncbi:MAG: hypothetical protein QOG20_839 [Pseudonocardiales bacterium]|jgi:hypothetical protein|nr:hypothetical protein [Pseudonocardiales bacterium]